MGSRTPAAPETGTSVIMGLPSTGEEVFIKGIHAGSRFVEVLPAHDQSEIGVGVGMAL